VLAIALPQTVEIAERLHGPLVFAKGFLRIASVLRRMTFRPVGLAVERACRRRHSCQSAVRARL